MSDETNDQRSTPRIRDRREVARWLAEGMTDQWLCEEYERRYDLATEPALWAAHRRVVAVDVLIPWAIVFAHRWAYALEMLRLEASRRTGVQLSGHDAERLCAFVANLDEGDLVIHYDPDTREGFAYVPRPHGIDTGLIRVPA